MSISDDKCSIWIVGDKKTIWNAITDEDKISQWYAPGSPWKIPTLNVGEQTTFTLRPSAHNNLTEELYHFLQCAAYLEKSQ